MTKIHELRYKSFRKSAVRRLAGGLILNAQGGALCASGMDEIGLGGLGVDRKAPFVERGDSTRRLDPELYRVLETSAPGRIRFATRYDSRMWERGYKRQLPPTASERPRNRQKPTDRLGATT